MPCINKPDSPSDLTIFIISFISSLEIINVVLPDPNIFLWIAASIAAAVNPNGIKMLLANGLSTFPIKDNPVFSNGPKSLTRNPPDCPVLWSWVFDNFIQADEPYGKALRSFETYVLVHNNLWGKLFSLLESPTGKLFSLLESPTIFDEIFKVTSVPFFIPDFNSLSCKLDNFMFKVFLYFMFKILCLSHFILILY